MNLSMSSLIKYGFFSEVLPQTIFTSNEVVNYINSNDIEISQLERKLRESGVKSTPCLFFSSYKNDFERRIMATPHLETYLVLSKEIENNSFKIFILFNENKNSYSNEIKPHDIRDYEIKSNFKENMIDKMKYSLGYRFVLKTDISQFYENIYTHSITWALLSKDIAKKEYMKKNNEKSEQYYKADRLDCKIRAINNNETKGIPTGPLSSRVVSEIILSEVDRELRNKQYKFRRYVDDYNFFFKDKISAESAISEIQNILYDYKLHINSNKTKILKFPFEINHNLNDELGKFDFKKENIINFFNKIYEFHLKGSKGALKYGLKVLTSEYIEFKDKEKELIFSQLINILISYPYLSKYIYDIFTKHDFKGNFVHGEILNEILSDEIKKKHNIEIIWILVIIMYFGQRISEDNILSILDSNYVYERILVLDYIFENRLNKKYDVSLKRVKEELKEESIYGEKWLLIYEANLNKWIRGIKRVVNKSFILKGAYKDNVKFYISPYSE